MATKNYETELSMLPEHMRQPMLNYIRKGWLPGGFLTSVLENNLKLAAGRADAINRRYLAEYAEYLIWYAPAMCWGSPERVFSWVERGGIEGLNAEAAKV